MLAFAAPAVQAETVAAVPAPTVFDIARFQIDGNSILPQAKVDGLMAPFAGPQRSFADVQKALEALQQAYYDAGYGAVQVRLPEQEMSNGVIQFRVIEGKIHKVAIEGAEFHDESNLLGPLPLKVGESPSAARIESTLKVVNENPSKKAQVFLKSGLVLGEIEARVKVVDQKPWKVGITLDNTGSEKTGKQRLGLFYQHANLWNKDHVFTFQYTTSPGHVGDVKIFGAGYHVPIYPWGDSVDVFAGYSDVSSGTISELFSVSGSGSVFGLRYNHNLARHDNYDHKIVLGYDHRAYRNNVALTGATGSLVPNISVKPVSLGYAANWKNLSQQLTFYITESANLEGGDRGSDEDFLASRAEADGDYMVTRYGADWVRLFDNDIRLHGNFSGQYSRQALVSGEQFGVGGAGSVRGFQERETANDRGYRFSAEVYSPDFGRKINAAVNARALAFYDYGSLHRNYAQAGEASHVSLASVGAGLRVGVGERFSLQADLARVVDAAGQQKNGDLRGHVSMVLTY